MTYTHPTEQRLYNKTQELGANYVLIPNTLKSTTHISKAGKRYTTRTIEAQCNLCGERYTLYTSNIARKQDHKCQRNNNILRTLKVKYSVDNPMQIKEYKAKQQLNREATMIKNQGSLSTKPYMAKREETVRSKYGVGNIMQVPKVQQRREDTNLKKYGVRCTLSNPKIRSKAHSKYEYKGIKFASSYEIAVYRYYEKRGVILEREPQTQYYYEDTRGRRMNYRPDFKDPRDGHLIEVKHSRYVKSKSYEALILNVAEVVWDKDNSISKYLEEAKKELGGNKWYLQFKTS